jgi:hypothetical protein
MPTSLGESESNELVNERNDAMKRAVFSLCFLLWLNAVSTVAAQGFYPDFALVVQLPSYETFMTNLGDSPIRIDGYSITSQSDSLSLTGWVRLAASGPDAVAALGPGVSQFETANPTTSSLFEVNPISSATWQPGQSWSIGFPFDSNDPNFLLDAELVISSPDGLLLTGGTVVTSPDLALASLIVVPEASGPGDLTAMAPSMRPTTSSGAKGWERSTTKAITECGVHTLEPPSGPAAARSTRYRCGAPPANRCWPPCPNPTLYSCWASL